MWQRKIFLHFCDTSVSVNMAAILFWQLLTGGQQTTFPTRGEPSKKNPSRGRGLVFESSSRRLVGYLVALIKFEG